MGSAANDLPVLSDNTLTSTTMTQEPIQAALSTAAALAAASSFGSNANTTNQPFFQERQHPEVILPLQATANSTGIATAPTPIPTQQPFLTSQPISAPAHLSQHQSIIGNYNLSANKAKLLPQNSQKVISLVYPTPAHPTLLPSNSIKNTVNSKNIFEQMNLRRGKWTPEEEAYAEFLIQEFEKGTVADCENGSTLRSFLSKKLHCAPMRISKKYAGKSIGKHVFLARSTVKGIGKQDEDNNSAIKLRDLEGKFYKSLCRDSEAANSLIGYTTTGHLDPTYPHNGTINSGQGIPISVFPCAQQSQYKAQSSQVTQSLPWSMQSTSASTSAAVPNPLQQTFLHAFNQSKNLPPQQRQQGQAQHSFVTNSRSTPQVQAPTPIAPAPNQKEIQSLNSRNMINVNLTRHRGPMQLQPASTMQQPQPSSHVVIKQPMNTNSHPTSGVLSMQPNTGGNIQSYSQTSSNHVSSQQVQNKNICSNSANTTVPTQLVPAGISYPTNQLHVVENSAIPINAPCTVIENKPFHSYGAFGNQVDAAAQDIPDFLSGFEKVAARSTVNNTYNNGTINDNHRNQHSPPFTSRSFDDIHQFGIGLSPQSPQPLELNNQHHGSNVILMSNHPGRPGQPESYAAAAQQLAFAVSQHSAYSNETPIPGIPSPLESRETREANSPPVTSVVNAANLRAHSLAASNKNTNVVSGSEKSDWGGTSTEETESTGVGYNGSGSDSATTSDNASDNASGDNESDSNSDSGPCKKKIKLKM